MSEIKSLQLSNGSAIPILGFGTWRMGGEVAYRAVSLALEAGYRHIDTATLYENEAEVGRALSESAVARDKIFITTKLAPDKPARPTIEKSLEDLGVDHVDLWLIHWPLGAESMLRAWEQFVEISDEGLATDIGVSNFNLGQIDELTAASGRTPAVNQIKWSPARYDAALAKGHRERKVVLEGYSPFKSCNLDHPILRQVADAHSVTSAQVVLRWHIQHDFVVIPKSQGSQRIDENFNVFGFSLSAAQMESINALAD